MKMFIIKKVGIYPYDENKELQQLVKAVKLRHRPRTSVKTLPVPLPLLLKALTHATVYSKNALGSRMSKKARNALQVIAQQPSGTTIQTETLKSKSTDKFMSYNRNKPVAKLGDSGIIKAERVSGALNPDSQ